MRSSTPIGPGAHLEFRDAVRLVRRVDTTSTGRQAWRCVGASERFRDQGKILLEEYESEVTVLYSTTTRLERNTSSKHRVGLLYIESSLHEVLPDEGLAYIWAETTAPGSPR